LTERKLIARVLAGDAAAERALYEAHVDRIWRLAYRMTGDADLAEDYTQDTFVRAFDHLAEFRGQSLLATWLHSVAVSVILNGLRKVQRHQQRETALEGIAPAAVSCPPPNVELALSLQDAIDGLTDDLRLVLVMHDLEGYKHEEIAVILNVPVGTTKTRLMRARNQVREAMCDRNAPLVREEGS
jgi:RNA polymerase sigma-70 factor (ECF subfamily)